MKNKKVRAMLSSINPYVGYMVELKARSATIMAGLAQTKSVPKIISRDEWFLMTKTEYLILSSARYSDGLTFENSMDCFATPLQVQEGLVNSKFVRVISFFTKFKRPVDFCPDKLTAAYYKAINTSRKRYNELDKMLTSERKCWDDDMVKKAAQETLADFNPASDENYALRAD